MTINLPMLLHPKMSYYIKTQGCYASDKGAHQSEKTVMLMLRYQNNLEDGTHGSG